MLIWYVGMTFSNPVVHLSLQEKEEEEGEEEG
jgi:hypothetical protein